MSFPSRCLAYPSADPSGYFTREWLIANGLGGYASGTSSGVVTRRYHGLLVSALPAPAGRMVMLSHVDAQIHLPSGRVLAIASDPPSASSPTAGGTSTAAPMAMSLVQFRLELGLPIWRYEGEGLVIEKRVLMPYRQNTVHLTYRLLSGPLPVRLEVRPYMHVRHYESALSDTLANPYVLTTVGGRFEVSAGADLPTLRLLFYGRQSALTISAEQRRNGYIEEQSRGYEHEGTIWSPGYFQVEFVEEDSAVNDATLVASTDSWEVLTALTPDAALPTERARRERLLEQAPERVRTGLAAELVIAADQFLVTPAARPEDATRAVALGTEARTVIAGYHWFTDWGRDTMISLEGLTLVTGREREAAFILRTFASYTRDGLIPNMFPDGDRLGLYHTADATLWFFHAVGRYVTLTRDTDTLHILLPVLRDIIEHHLRGTRFGIGVDSSDGLLRQGEEGYQLTWMDAKVDGFVVTPRRGKAVEINALFYNALRLLEGWIRAEEGDEAAHWLKTHADRAERAFNRRFWYDAGGYLYDVVDGEAGDDTACRPNQLFAISLTHPVLDRTRWPAVIDTVRRRLLTPYGLRTLAPGHPDYRSKYYGDLKSRDAAYHQGTVWPWLIGPFIDAWLRVYPDNREAAREMLQAFNPHLGEAGAGSVSEIFDAESPYAPRGCIAQAWSVAEVLRSLNGLSQLV
jgi:predicted glycogen debranching enzyme